MLKSYYYSALSLVLLNDVHLRVMYSSPHSDSFSPYAGIYLFHELVHNKSSKNDLIFGTAGLINTCCTAY